MKNIPKELDTIADVVLRYKPPEKAKATKPARNGGQTRCKERLTILMYIIPQTNESEDQ